MINVPNRRAEDSQRMMFYTLEVIVFLLPFQWDFTGIFLVIGWFFFFLRNYYAGWKWRKTILDIPILIFLLCSFLSIFNSPIKGFSFYNWYHLVGEYVLLYYLTVQAITDEEQCKTLCKVIGIAAVIVFLYGFFQYFTGLNTLNQKWVDTSEFPGMKTRIYSTWENPNLFAGYLDMLLGFFFALFFTCKEEEKWRWFSAGGFILAMLSLALTYARGAILSIAVVLFLYIIWKKKKLVFPFIILCGAVLFLDKTLLARMLSVFSTGDSSTSLRLGLWDSTLSMIMDHPFLGIGWGAYFKVYPSYDYYMQGHFIKIVHAHNMYLNIAAETGIIGALAFSGLLFCSIYYAVKNYSYLNDEISKGIVLGTALALGAIAINGLTDYVLFNSDLSLFFWFICAVNVSLLQSKSLLRNKIKNRNFFIGWTALPKNEDKNKIQEEKATL